MSRTPSTPNRPFPNVSASAMVGKIGTPCCAARSRLRSLAGTCAVYSDTMRERGLGGRPSCRKPSRYLPMITSAWELGLYSVTTAAIRLGSPSEPNAAAVERRNARRLSIADPPDPASEHQLRDFAKAAGAGVGIDGARDFPQVAAICILCEPVRDHFRRDLQMKL